MNNSKLWAALAGLLVCGTNVAEAAVLDSLYYFQEQRRTTSGVIREQLQWGMDFEFGSVIHPVVTQASTHTILGLQPLVEFLPFKDFFSPDPVEEFGVVIVSPPASASGSVSFEFTDQIGSITATSWSIAPTVSLPLVSDVVVIGSDSSPLVTWINPFDPAGLAALGVDGIRVRVLDDSGPLFEEIFEAPLLGLDTEMVELMGLPLGDDYLLRVELVDFDLVTSSFQIDGGPVMEVLADRQVRRSTYQLRFDVTTVPEPWTLSLMVLGLVSIGFSMRWRRKSA